MNLNDLFSRAGGISCVASITPRAGEYGNEDAAKLIATSAGEFHGVTVADGLGSFAHAREAARLAVCQAAALAATLNLEDPADLRDLFAEVRRELREYAFAQTGSEAEARSSFATTLIVAVETPARLVAAYAGNGAIWHIRGNFDRSIGRARIPWTAINHLNPHSTLHGGREDLYNILSGAEELEAQDPTVIAIDKDRRFGDILLICTDGIYSPDQLTYGTDAEGKGWLSVDPAMALFYEALQAYFDQWSEEPDALQIAMDGYLSNLKERRLLEDDATLGIIITQAALEHQKRRRSRSTSCPSLQTSTA